MNTPLVREVVPNGLESKPLKTLAVEKAKNKIKKYIY